MKRLLVALAVGSAAPLAIPSAVQAQPWQSINQRQAELDRRIDQGVRNGSLTANEASQLRRDYNDLSRLEEQYRRSDGISVLERNELDRQFDVLSRRIRTETRDRDQRGDGPWQSINQRQAELDRRIDQGVRNGSLTANEAARLRRDFADLNRLEAQYRRSDRRFSDFERRDLDRRFDDLSRRIRSETRDRDQRGDDRWQSINDRQQDLYRRIDQGVRNRDLTATEAGRLRSEYMEIARIEAQYRQSGGGLNDTERRDLDRRFDLLSQRIRFERQDDNRR